MAGCSKHVNFNVENVISITHEIATGSTLVSIAALLAMGILSRSMFIIELALLAWSAI